MQLYKNQTKNTHIYIYTQNKFNLYTMANYEFTHTINGKAVKGERFFDVFNPATGQVFAKCPDATKAQLNEAIAGAKRAFKSWSKTSLVERKEYLKAAQAKLMARLKEFAHLLTLEQGKTIADATGEIGGAAAWMDATINLEMPPVEVIAENDESRMEVHYKPLGVVAAICPWNFPVTLAQWKICPAVYAGNTIVLKPSPHTPLTSLLLGEVYRDTFPPGVVNIVAGGNDLGAWMTTDPRFAKVSFTGSIETGKKIQEVCADDLKRVTLELGGNDAAIILPEADPVSAAPDIFAGAFANSGQVCSAIKRIYVHEDKYESFVQEMTKIAKDTTFGDGMAEGSQYGPLNNKMQFEKVAAYVEDARKNGARITTGGKARGQGYIYEPTIIADVDESFKIVSEEQFGPAVPIMKYKTVDEAVDRANDTNYGLSGSVWGPDAEKAAEVAARLEVGTSWVNQHLAITPVTPFGGRKWSGIGRENGKWGLSAFLEPFTLNIKKKSSVRALSTVASKQKVAVKSKL